MTLVGLLLTAACSAQPAPDTFAANPPIAPAQQGVATARYLRHVILVIQENRSFDNLFAKFPGADGATEGKMSDGKTVRLRKSDLAYPYDAGHSWQDFVKAYDDGKMDGFNLESNGGIDAGTKPYVYVDPSQIAPYWDIARAFVLADHLFQTQGSGSFTAHQDLIRGGTAIDSQESLIDYPSSEPWGCDAPAGTTTSILTTSQHFSPFGGPFPCLPYRTLRDLLDAKGVSWKYFSPRVTGSTGAVWNAFDAIRAVRYGSDWQKHVTSTSTAIFKEIKLGTLPSMSWVVPTNPNSDHPGPHVDYGPAWVTRIVDAVGESPYWKSSAVIIVWDDWGGFYDNVPPPFRDRAGGLGFRVPMLVVSPYARKGFVAHRNYEFGSILKFIEDNWDLGRLGTSDVRAASMIGCFDFGQPSRKFVPIQADRSQGFFEAQAPSTQPVDDE